jgi:hypothetical protein
MKSVLLTLCCLTLLLAGCEVIPGENWHLTPGNLDTKLGTDSVHSISNALVDRLHLTIIGISPETQPEKKWGQVAIAELRPDDPNVKVTVLVDRADSMISLNVQRYSEGFFVHPVPSSAADKAYAARVLAVMKDLYPNSTITPFIAHEGLLGP